MSGVVTLIEELEKELIEKGKKLSLTHKANNSLSIYASNSRPWNGLKVTKAKCAGNEETGWLCTPEQKQNWYKEYLE